MKINSKKWKKVETFYIPLSILTTNYPFRIRLYKDESTLVLEENYMDNHAAVQFWIKTSDEADFIIEHVLSLITVLPE